MFDDYPNVMIAPVNEPITDIIEDYVEMVKYAVTHGGSLEELLNDFATEINMWTSKQVLIDQIKQNFQELENLHEEEKEFYGLDENIDE